MPAQSSRIRSGERGAALILFSTVLALVVLPLVGLSIDGGVAYFAQARLSSAADAAALAGARSLNVGQDLASQIANAQSIAKQYFNANFPPGILNSTNIQVTDPQITQTSYHTITVQFQASADVQLSFLGLLGQSTAHITASSMTSRRDVNIMLAIDRSGSMAGVCEVMKADAENFVDRFVNGRDRLGLVTFMGDANIDYPATKNFKSQSPSLNDTIAQLVCANNTGSAAALTLAHQQILAGTEPGALNVVVFFTDGVPNGFTGNFLLKTGTCNGSNAVNAYIADEGGMYNASLLQPIYSAQNPLVPNCPNGSQSQLGRSYQAIPDTDFWGNSSYGYGSVTRDSNNHIVFSSGNSDSVSLNAADDAAKKIRTDSVGIVIYAIGLGSNGGVDSAFLERVANDPISAQYNASQTTGKYYYSPTAGQLGAAFQSIASEILKISK